MSADELVFASEKSDAVRPWRIMVVDDEEEVHAVTRLALDEFEFEGRPLEILDALSAAEAKQVWNQNSDIAMVLLDVVMESETSGFDFVHFVREEKGDLNTRLVLRTGHSGDIPAPELVARYEIDDYRSKTELTFERLGVIIRTALRNYRLLTRMTHRQRQLEDAILDLERFVFLASHDLQTPLRSTINFAQLLERKHAQELTEDAKELLGFVTSGAREMQHLVDDILEYSRAGRADDAIQRLSLSEILDGTCERLAPMIERRGARIERGEFLPGIKCHPAQMALLFLHLIENAIKFQPGESPLVRVEVKEQDLNLEIRISDEGIGIDSEFLDYIFAPFRHLHTVDQYPGNGIGLAICRRIAEAHGGKLRAESVVGEGTSMIVSLPVS